MIYDFFYYNIIGFTLSLSGFYLLEYISHPNDFGTRLTYHKDVLTYWTIDKIVSIKLLYDECIVNKIGNIYQRIRTPYEEENSDFIYKKGEEEIVFRRLVIDDEYYYSENNNGMDIVNPFISIELHINNRVHDITKKMKHFCIVGNTFDYNFFINFLNKFCNVKKNMLISTMNIHIVDTNCDIAEISMNKHKIMITKNGYNIK